ncbi:Deoxyribose-phosphate aldolase [hydrothermal vent metagenome]|uniref:deoxyribose-phosphate aldolase n=1 Tax=hydrothermal vent metagenome TaxID=652676 RepID=A0A3B0R339_9ZZZZ
MTHEELAKYIDISVLKPDITRKEIAGKIDAALHYPFASICIPPSHVAFAFKRIDGRPLKVTTVVGFPFGYQTKETKIAEAKQAVSEGATELDLVMNMSFFKSGEAFLVEEEIREVVEIVPVALVKVIIECAYLNYKEKTYALEMAINGGARFIKTATGYGPGVATTEDVKLLKEFAGDRINIKTAGGINDLDAALELIRAGTDRIGTSAGIKMVEELKERNFPTPKEEPEGPIEES